MRMRHLLPALALGVGLLGLAVVPAPAADTADAKNIAKLIEQLGSDSFEERQKATDALDAIGGPALEALRKAASSPDAEVRKRAGDLVSRIAKRTASAQALKPTMVHLVYKDTPVSAVIEDLRKKSGHAIVLNDTEGKLKEKKITLDTGKTTFWKALELVCEKAGLVEGDPTAVNVPPAPGAVPRGVPVPVPAPAAPRPPAPAAAGAAPAVRNAPVPARAIRLPALKEAEKKEEEKKDADKKAADRKDADKKAEEVRKVAFEAAKAAELARQIELLKRAAAARGVAGVPGAPAVGFAPMLPAGGGWMPVQPGQITLVPGKLAGGPVDTATAVRVRPADKKLWGTAGVKELQIVLQVTPEPRLRWQHLASVAIDKAIDNNEEKLSAAIMEQPAGGGVVAPNGVIVLPAGGVAVAGVRGRLAVGGGMPFIPYNPGSLHQYVPVRLKKGDKESKSLKELSGTISAQLLGEAEAVITADGILKAAGKSFKGKTGGEIKVNAVNKMADGTVQVQFEFEAPADVVAETPMNQPWANPAPGGIRLMPLPAPPVVAPPAGAGAAPNPAAPAAAAVRAAVAARVVLAQPGVGAGGAVIAFPGGVATTAGSPYGLTLQDDKGNVLPATIHIARVRAAAGAAPKLEYVARYRPAGKDAAEPARLVFTGRRSIDVNIPFKLENIDLK